MRNYLVILLKNYVNVVVLKRKQKNVLKQKKAKGMRKQSNDQPLVNTKASMNECHGWLIRSGLESITR